MNSVDLSRVTWKREVWHKLYPEGKPGLNALWPDDEYGPLLLQDVHIAILNNWLRKRLAVQGVPPDLIEEIANGGC